MSDKKRIVLLGQQGAGKTFLFNKLTGNKQPTKLFGGSLTKQIVSGHSIHGNGFEVIDTPGFDASEEKALHAAAIAAGLSYGLMNRIIIVIRSDRDKRIVKDIKSVYKCLTRFTQNITIYFSFFDSSDGTEATKNLLRDLLKNNFNLTSCLFGTKDSSPESIISEIDDVLMQKSSQAISTELLNSEIISTFDFLEEDDNIELADIIVNLQVFFKPKVLNYHNFLKKLEISNPYFLEILHQLQFHIKNEANQLLEAFEKKHQNRMNELFSLESENLQYLPHMLLSKEINQIVYQLFEKIEKKKQQHKDNIYQCLRQCPGCDQIWMKVFGCDMVICGRQVGAKFDRVFNLDLRPKIEFSEQDGQLTCKILKKQALNDEQELINILKSFYDKKLSKEIKDQLMAHNFEKFFQILKEEISQDFITDISKRLDLGDLENFYSQLTKILKNLIEIIPEYELKQIKSIGCGKKFNWESEGKPIMQSLTASLISSSLSDYFAQITDEKAQMFKNEFETMNSRICKQKESCLFLPKKDPSVSNLSNQESVIINQIKPNENKPNAAQNTSSSISAVAEKANQSMISAVAEKANQSIILVDKSSKADKTPNQ